LNFVNEIHRKNFHLASTRFVKCEKCNHFFVVISENEGSKKLKDEKIKKRPPLPSPKKVFQIFICFFS